MGNDFFITWSIITSILALLFLGWDIWQFASSRKEKEIQLKDKELHKAQVKIWQHFANGINHSLIQVNEAIKKGELDNLEIKKILPLISGIQANAYSLFTSLNEERLFTEEEIKQRQLEREEQFKKFIEGPSSSTSSSKPINQ